MASLKDASRYLSLTDAISTLKEELIKADAAARQRNDALLEFVECEIELSLEFEPKLGTEFNLGVFKVQAGAGVKGGHKVKLKFKSDKIIVAAATVSGEEVEALEPKKPTIEREAKRASAAIPAGRSRARPLKTR